MTLAQLVTNHIWPFVSEFSLTNVKVAKRDPGQISRECFSIACKQLLCCNIYHQVHHYLYNTPLTYQVTNHLHYHFSHHNFWIAFHLDLPHFQSIFRHCLSQILKSITFKFSVSFFLIFDRWSGSYFLSRQSQVFWD